MFSRDRPIVIEEFESKQMRSKLLFSSLFATLLCTSSRAEPASEPGCQVLIQVANAIDESASNEPASIAANLALALEAKLGAQCQAPTERGTRNCTSTTSSMGLSFRVFDQATGGGNGVSLAWVMVRFDDARLNYLQCFQSDRDNLWARHQFDANACNPAIWKLSSTKRSVIAIKSQPTQVCDGYSDNFSLTLTMGSMLPPNVR